VIIEKIKPNPITFGYKSPLKSEWIKNKEMQKRVQYGLYGDKLTAKTISLEHLLPHSLGGKTTLSNLAIASKSKNCLRGNRPITEFLTFQMVKDYLIQFVGLKTPKFDGDIYIQKTWKTFKKLGIKNEF
jgi:hypothetical protein